MLRRTTIEASTTTVAAPGEAVTLKCAFDADPQLRGAAEQWWTRQGEEEGQAALGTAPELLLENVSEVPSTFTINAGFSVRRCVLFSRIIYERQIETKKMNCCKMSGLS